MKKRKYDEGGDVLEAANASEESQSIAKSMGAGPKNEAAPKAAAPKQRVVSKAELEKSGLSLRDFLNKERGLTRRSEPKPKEKPVNVTQSKEYPAGTSILDRSQADRDAIRDLGLKRAEGERAVKAHKAKQAAGYAKGGSIKASSMGSVKTAKPSFGSASSRADGIASKGKTRGRYI